MVENRRMKLEYHDYLSLNLYIIRTYLMQLHFKPKSGSQNRYVIKAVKALNTLKCELDNIIGVEYPERNGGANSNIKTLPTDSTKYYYSVDNQDLAKKMLNNIVLSKEPAVYLTPKKRAEFDKELKEIPDSTTKNKELSDIYDRIINLIPADDKTGLKEKIQTELEIIDERFAKYKLLLDL